MIRVIVQDERGNNVSSAVDVEASVLARPNDHRFSCLRFVDAYGDTVFNRLQLPPLLDDLRLLRDLDDASKHEAVLQQIEALVRQCQTEPHLYLKLIGH